MTARPTSAEQTRDATWKAEERGQAQILAEVIQGAIDEAGRTLLGSTPILNAVAGALVTVEAGMLASIEDPRHRKALRKAMERALPEAIATARVHGHPQVIDIGGVRQ